MRLFSVSVISLPEHVEKILYRTAKRFISQYHYLGYAPPGCRFALGVFVGRTLVGVMIFGRPVARLEDQDTTLELTRMALIPNTPKNSCSKALSLAEKWIKQNHPEFTRLIAYSDTEQEHKGTIYKAANWKETGKTQGHSWSCPSRRRDRGQIGGDKLKFERVFGEQKQPQPSEDKGS